MNGEHTAKTVNTIEDFTVNVKIKLSILWIAHAIIWTYGDTIRLVHPGYIEEIIDSPASNELLLFVAAPLGIIQTFMIIGSVMWESKVNRRINLTMGILYFVINIGYVFDLATNQSPAWEYLLVFVYVLLNILVIKNAWLWQIKRI